VEWSLQVAELGRGRDVEREMQVKGYKFSVGLKEF
jgi:hypothetical protein